MFKGLCPLHLQIPLGKVIDVEFGHYPPFSFSSPLGGVGSDFLVLQLLARKNGFVPRFIYGTNITAMLSNVRFIIHLISTMC